MAAWVWWRGELAASLRSWRLRERAVDSQEVWQDDMPKGLHGWVEQKQPLERSFSLLPRSHPRAPSGRSPEWGGLVSPTLAKGGMVASGKHLKEGIGSVGQPYLLEIRPGDSRG